MKGSWFADLMTAGLLLSFLTGCATLGPRSITAGRMAYAEAINQTQDEQILLSIVKGRYGESSTLLAVNGVAANLSFQAEAGIEAGFSGAGDVGEDLLIGGIAYEENPTITYVPVQGEDYVREIMTPVPLDLLFLMVRSSSSSPEVMMLLVSRINGIRNPDFLTDSETQPDVRFKRLVELFSELTRNGTMELVQSTDDTAVFDIWLAPLTEKDIADTGELMDLLGLPKENRGAGKMVIPVYFGIRADESWRVGITTRSTYNLAEIMRAAVEVPEEHANAGLAIDYPNPGPACKGIRIQSSSGKPKGRSLAVQYRGYWFWIDESDLETKAVFRFMRSLWSMSIAGATNHASGPVLTLPVAN